MRTQFAQFYLVDLVTQIFLLFFIKYRAVLPPWFSWYFSKKKKIATDRVTEFHKMLYVLFIDLCILFSANFTVSAICDLLEVSCSVRYLYNYQEITLYSLQYCYFKYCCFTMLV